MGRHRHKLEWGFKNMVCIGCRLRVGLARVNALEAVAEAALELDWEISGYGPHMDGTFSGYKIISSPEGRERVRRFREVVLVYRDALDALQHGQKSGQIGQ